MNKLTQHLLGRRDAKGHGGGVRGADLSRRSVQFEGRFGRMFRTLPPADFDDEDLRFLAAGRKEAGKLVVAGMTADAERNKDEERIATPEELVDDEENFGIPAGYTYVGQFIDHDLTFDPVSALQGQNDPDGLTDFRTPRFDLDSIYARGPADQPYMFEGDGKSFLLGRTLSRNGNAPVSFDLPRTKSEKEGFRKSDRAIIGDKRNDENVIVSQLHGVFLRLHNRVVHDNPDLSFSEVQEIVRWHYQWVVVNDFLPRIVGPETFNAVLPHLASGKNIFEDPPRLHFYKPRQGAYIPIEFSAAAYRFGHSMVRPIYRLNVDLGVKESLKEEDPHTTFGRQLIFASEGAAGLNGFREFDNRWSIDWSLFFELEGTLDPANTTTKGARRIQPSYKIDTSMVNPLDFLPEFCQKKPDTDDLLLKDGTPVAETDPFTHMPDIPNLAHRNLLRGRSLGLPSGQTVARAMGLTPLKDSEILIGKAIVDDTFGTVSGDPPANQSIVEFGQSFVKNAPLWVYILAEAQNQWATEAEKRLKENNSDRDAANAIKVHLGPVGGRIVAETFVGLMLADSYSYLSQDPTWQPNPEWCEAGKFGMPQLIKAALG